MTSYRIAEFDSLLDAVLPVNSYRKKVGAGGKAVWVLSGNVWTLTYAAGDVGHVGAVLIVDERNMVKVSLFREAVVSLAAVLKAVGALPL